MRLLTASCLCGKVKIQIPDIFDYMGNCHRSECRKFTGSSFSAVAGVDFDDFKIVEGEASVSCYHKTEDTDLGFCKHCGSSLFSKKFKTRKYNIRLGILDDAPVQRATFHVFVASKVSVKRTPGYHREQE